MTEFEKVQNSRNDCNLSTIKSYFVTVITLFTYSTALGCNM